MIRIALCDSDTLWREKTAAYIKEFEESRYRLSVHLSVFSSEQELLKAVIMYGPFDIYVLDVVFSKMNGIELGHELRKYDETGKLIYYAASPDYGVESYTVGAFYYFLKSADRHRFFGVLERAAAACEREAQSVMTVKTAEGFQKISADDIVYVELNGKSLTYRLTDGEPIRSVSQRQAFARCVAPLLSDARFMLVGTSCCVNLFFVKAVQKDSVILKYGERLWLPQKGCAELRRRWLAYCEGTVE